MSVAPYHIAEGFVPAEDCKALTEFFMNNMEWDPRDFYSFHSLGGYFDGDKKPMPFDPHGHIHRYVDYAENWFRDNYYMMGTFGLDRIHGNYMHENALLHDHHDDRAGEKPLADINSLTYVAGLFLNDDYEGGELTFPEHNIVLKPKAGDLVLFPGYLTRHGVNQVTKGTRLNILAHFFDIKDPSIPYEPDYAVDPRIYREKNDR